MNLREAALGYAEAGLPVFPLVPSGKAPLTTHGLYAATSDLNQITAWWTRTPNANIGLPTGPTSGWDILDVDVAKDSVAEGRQRRSGWEVVNPALKTGGLDPPAMIIRTPSGGAHLYYKASPGAKNGSLAHYGLDFKAEGGYVVVPPSSTAAGHYEVSQALDRHESLHTCNFTKLCELTQRVDGSRPVPSTAARLSQNDAASAPPHLRARRMDALIQTVAGAKIGNRNNMLYWAARVAAEEGLVCLDQLYQAGRSSGLAHHEASATIQSAIRGPQGHSA